MKNLDRLENLSRSKVATLCAGSVYPLTGGNDSSRDYWKVIKDKNGKVTGVIDDKNYDKITYVDTDGNILDSESVSGSLSGQIAASTGKAQSKQDINTIMINSGLGHTGQKGTTWFVNDSAKQNALITSLPGENDAKKSMTQYAMSAIQGFINGATVLGKAGKAIIDTPLDLASMGEKWLAQHIGFSRDYYGKEKLSEPDFGAKEITTDADTKEHLYPRISWYEYGHPAVDLAGNPGASVLYPKDLTLLESDGNKRLLFQIDGTKDYLMFSDVDSSDITQMEVFLKSTNVALMKFSAGSQIFKYPKENQTNSTNPHLHVEMYRQDKNGNYWFADPTTGKLLDNYTFQVSNNKKDRRPWLPKLPEYNFSW